MDYPTAFPEDCDPYFSYNLTTQIWYAYSLVRSSTEFRLVIIGLPIVLAISVLANGAFLFVVAKIKRLHTITNLYLASLAVSDLVFVSTSIIPYIYTFTVSRVRHDTPFNTFVGCTFSFGLPISTYFTSVGLVTLVTLERYYGICFPLKQRAIASKSRTKKFIVFTWLAGFMLGLIQSLAYSKLQRYCVIWPHLPDFEGWPQQAEFCLPISDHVVLLSELIDTLPFFVALLMNGYMYARIMYSLGHRELLKKVEQREGRDNLKIQAGKVRKQVARLLIVNGTLFFICQICFRFHAIDNILREILGIGLYGNYEVKGIMLVFGRGMLYLNSSLNPFIYCLTSGYYRDASKEAFYGLVHSKGHDSLQRLPKPARNPDGNQANNSI